MRPERNVPPHNLDAEASVLGGVILGGAKRKPEEVLALLATLEVDHFYDHKHKVVFAAMRNLESVGTPIDVVTLEVEIEKMGKLPAIGGIGFLGELALRVPTADNVVAYAEITIDKARIRALMEAAGEVLEKGYRNDLSADELLDGVLTAITRIEVTRGEETIELPTLLERRQAELEAMAVARARGETALVGLPTGIEKLDAQVGGYPLGDLTILAARPAMGKTAMAMAAVEATTAAGFDAHVFSAEGGWRMYADRVLSKGSGIPVARVRSGDITSASDAGRLAEAMVRYRKRDNWALDPRADLTPREIVRCVRARLMKRSKAGVKTKTLVVVDYLNILARPAGDMNENDAFNEMITTLAKAAVNDDVAYLVLAQLNRDCEKRDDKRPRKSDLRGSGALEERARLIVSPYRGSEYYDEPRRDIDYDCECPPKAMCVCAPTVEQWKQTVQILLLKNNNGPTGRAFANWRPETTEMW